MAFFLVCRDGSAFKSLSRGEEKRLRRFSPKYSQ